MGCNTVTRRGSDPALDPKVEFAIMEGVVVGNPIHWPACGAQAVEIGQVILGERMSQRNDRKLGTVGNHRISALVASTGTS